MNELDRVRLVEAVMATPITDEREPPKSECQNSKVWTVAASPALPHPLEAP
jgi:hypothetical protein